LGKAAGIVHSGLDLTGTVFLYLQGTFEPTATGESRLRLGDEVQLSRSWLRQRLRHALHGQQIVILNGGHGENLSEWVEDLQLNGDHSQAILAGADTAQDQFVSLLLNSLIAPEPATGLSIAGWIAQLQRQMADTDMVLHTWLSGPRVIDVLLGQRAGRGIAESSPVDLGICPYRGLQAFQVADAPYFFGRETLTQQLMTALHRQPLLAVIGASGSGKSSVVQAGLMAALRQGQQIPDSDRWWLGYLRPAEQPLNALVNALVEPGTEREQFYQQQQLEGLLHQGTEGFVQWLRARPEPMVVLVVDQFEELFSLTAECDRAPFLSLLLGGLEHASDRFKLVLTLRSDFMATALEDATLATLLPPATVLVPPVLSPDDYRQIILNPAEKVGLQVESALVDVLLRDLDQGIGNLPLLEFVLEQIWLQRDSGTLRLQTYQQTVGGLEGALERKAQAVYDSLDPEAQDCARWLFLSLTHLGDGTDDSRRRIPRTALTVPRYPDSLVDRTLQAFITAKLIVVATEDLSSPLPQPKGHPTDPPTHPPDSRPPTPDPQCPLPPSPSIEVAHEILIRRWSTLRWWLDENRTRLRSQRQLEQVAQQWHNSGQQPEYLLQGVRLDAATELYVRYTDELSQPVQEFVEACLAAQTQEQKRQRQQLRRARMAVGAISGLALITLGLGGLAYRQQQQALANEIAALNALATAQEQSHQSLESLITSIQAGQQLQRLNGFGLGRQVRASHRVHTLTTLYQAVTQITERNRLQGHTQPVNRAVFSPDGSRIASASDDGTLRLWDSDGELLQVWEGNGERFTDVAFHPEGNLIAAASTDGSVWLWQPETEAEPVVFTAHPDWVRCLAFSPDGTLLATASRDGTVRLWQVSDQQLLRTLSGHQGWVNTVQFSPDGQRLASGGEDGTVRIWDARTGNPIAARRPGTKGQSPASVGNGQAPAPRGERINDLAFSPNGEFLVSASDDQTLGVWAFIDNSLTVLDTGNRRPTSVQVSPDSQLIVAGTSDGTLQLWRVSSQEMLAQLAGHSDAVHSVAFATPISAPEGPQVPQQVTLLSAGTDNTIRLWATPVVADAPQAADPSSYPIAPHPDGQTYAIGGWDGNVVLQSPTQRQTLSGHSSPVLALAYSSTGEWLVSGEDDGTIRLWEGDTGQAEQTLTGHQGRITSLAFSPDERQLLSGSADQTAILWDLPTGQPLHTFEHQDEVTAVAWSPRGNVIATGGVDGTIKLWRPNGQLLHLLEGHDLEIAALAFSPDGKILASSGWDRTLRLWRVGDGILLHTLTNPQDTAVRLEFTVDGHTLLAEDRYGQTQVWNSASGQLLTTFIPTPATLTPQLLTGDGVVLQPPLALWQQLNRADALSTLLQEGCDRIADYLATNGTLNSQDRELCDAWQ
jgi:WD40 repeat protein